MRTVPDQADAETASLRDQAFLELREAMPGADLEAALRCSAQLRAALPDPGRLDRNLVLVAFGGGKDSSYTLAFVRVMQLILFRAHGSTFRLRVATNRHAGMPRAVMENIDREYQALRLTADPDCELLLIDGSEVAPFDVDSPRPDHVLRRNRLDILMTGHRTLADGRPTFCNACNLSVANSFGLAASFGGGADLLVTGDSQLEQRQYTLWIGRLARKLAPDARPTGPAGFGRLLSRLDGISQAYFTDIYDHDAEAIAERRVTSEVPSRLRFFSIYSETEYAVGDHMRLLTDFLGFRFDDVAFSFTESDCGNPALMAHLRGLKCERLYERSYAEGLAEYVGFALGLMRKKDFPDDLIELIRQRYEGPEAVARMRAAADDYAMETFGLAEEQLVCMTYSPFTGRGARLGEFLDREHPTFVRRASEIHAFLSGDASDAPEIADLLEHVSGLGSALLRALYRSQAPSPSSRVGDDLVGAVLAGDPHKAVIPTRHAHDGPITYELISGRLGMSTEIVQLDRSALLREYGLETQRLQPWAGLHAPFEGSWAVARPGTRSTLHSHHEREIFLAVRGAAVIECDEECRPFVAGDVAYFLPGRRHRLLNDGDEEFIFYSVWWDEEMARQFIAHEEEEA